MKLAVYQSDCAGLSAGERLQRLDQVLAQSQCDLLVCPELFMSGYHCPQTLAAKAEPVRGETVSALSALAAAHSSAIISGFCETDAGELFNSAVLVGADGTVRGVHRKLVLPPGFERDVFSRGEQLQLHMVGDIRLAMLICYDAEFPESVRAAARAGAQLVVVPTALGAQWQQVALHVMRSRAFENGVWLAYANHAGQENGLDYAGLSCIVTPFGQDAARAGRQDEVISSVIDTAAVGEAQERLPYIAAAGSFVEKLTVKPV